MRPRTRSHALKCFRQNRQVGDRPIWVDINSIQTSLLNNTYDERVSELWWKLSWDEGTVEQFNYVWNNEVRSAADDLRRAVTDRWPYAPERWNQEIAQLQLCEDTRPFNQTLLNLVHKVTWLTLLVEPLLAAVGSGFMFYLLIEDWNSHYLYSQYFL